MRKNSTIRCTAGQFLVVGVLVGVSVGTFMTSAYGNPSQKNSSATEDVYKALFGKKRSSAAEQKRTRTNTTVMGLRGLDDDPHAALKTTATANMRAVYEMEDRRPNAETVSRLREQLSREIGTDLRQSLPPPIANAEPTLAELEVEIDLGRKMAAQVLGANKTYDNKKVVDYVSALTETLALSGLRSERPFRIAILNSEQINAFACPGGYIFVTKGALKATRSEAQLAALLGHEIVHVSNRHLLTSLQKKIKAKETKKEQTGSIDPHSKARQRIKAESTGESSAWAQVLGPKGVGLSLLQASSEALETLLSRGLEKEFELEADRLGQQLSSASGYSSSSLSALLGQMKAQSGATRNASEGTHPPYDVRIESVAQFIETMNGRNAAVAQGSKLFSEMQREWSVQ